MPASFFAGPFFPPDAPQGACAGDWPLIRGDVHGTITLRLRPSATPAVEGKGRAGGDEIMFFRSRRVPWFLAVGVLLSCDSLSGTEIVLSDLAVVDSPSEPNPAVLAPGSREARKAQLDLARRTGLPIEVQTRVTGIAMRLIPAGSFLMGSPETERGRDLDEGPVHEVSISRPFYMGKYEITQRQWESVMEFNPSEFASANPRMPLENVRWEEAAAFVRLLCEMEGVPEGTYRLPTEAEWEYACRAGTRAPFCFGDILDLRLANFDGEHPYGGAIEMEPPGTTVRIGLFPPNAWGLYDMHGNVWEWCSDFWGKYPPVPLRDPAGPRRGAKRVARGGCWISYGRTCRSANRWGGRPDFHAAYLGVRIVRELPLPAEAR